jgi:hypothetical protein
MSKSEVYSWRLEPALMAELEAAARGEKVPLAVVLERLTRDWLRQRREQDEVGAGAPARRIDGVRGVVRTREIGDQC